MGLNFQDVRTLNDSITGIGDTFMKREQMRNEAGFRQQMLDREIERGKAATAHYGAMDDAAKKAAAKQDAILRSQEAQNAIKAQQQQYKNLNEALDNGKITEDQFNDQALKIVGTTHDATNTILENGPWAPWNRDPNYRMKKGQAKQASTYGPVAADKAAAALEDQANQLDASQLEADPSLQSKIDELRRRAKIMREGKPANLPPSFVETQLPGGAKRRDYVAPRTTATAPSKPLPLPADKTKLIKGQSYQTSKGLAVWDGTKFMKQ